VAAIASPTSAIETTLMTMLVSLPALPMQEESCARVGNFPVSYVTIGKIESPPGRRFGLTAAGRARGRRLIDWTTAHLCAGARKPYPWLPYPWLGSCPFCSFRCACSANPLQAKAISWRMVFWLGFLASWARRSHSRAYWRYCSEFRMAICSEFRIRNQSELRRSRSCCMAVALREPRADLLRASSAYPESGSRHSRFRASGQYGR
jgi:hypothetical protein